MQNPLALVNVIIDLKSLLCNVFLYSFCFFIWFFSSGLLRFTLPSTDWVEWCIQCLQQITTTWAPSRNRHVTCHGSGGRKSEIKAALRVPCEARKVLLVARAPWWFLACRGIPAISAPIITRPSPWSFGPSSPRIRTAVIGSGPRVQYDFILTWLRP